MVPGATNSAQPGVRPVLIQMTAGGRKLNVRVDAPTGPIPPAALLPLYRNIAERLTAVAVKGVEQEGRRVACAKGCAACCRQVVAVSALEARELVKLIGRLPEPQRARVRERFAAARRRLEAEAPHLLPQLLHPTDAAADGTGLKTEAELHEFSRAYLRLGIACPFLEDEACSIYEERPVACRQYVVVSDPVHCATLSPEVRAVVPAGGVAHSWAPVAEYTARGRPVEFVALIAAPDFVAEHPQEPPARPGTDLLGDYLARMKQRGTWT